VSNEDRCQGAAPSASWRIGMHEDDLAAEGYARIEMSENHKDKEMPINLPT
jgi:hypothetical protein